MSRSARLMWHIEERSIRSDSKLMQKWLVHYFSPLLTDTDGDGQSDSVWYIPSKPGGSASPDLQPIFDYLGL